MRFRPEQHLRRQSDFRIIREQGRRLNCGLFTLWWRSREIPSDSVRRLGVVASTAAVGNAVHRNRAKRRLREVFRRHQQLVPAGSDLLLVARRAVSLQPFPLIEEKFVGACHQLSASAHV